MRHSSLTPVFVGLRTGLHLLSAALLAVVVVLLLIDMTRRVRRVQARARVEERQAQLEREEAEAALQIADRAYVMELGEFVLSGSAKDIAANKGVAASYLGFQHEG